MVAGIAGTNSAENMDVLRSVCSGISSELIISSEQTYQVGVSVRVCVCVCVCVCMCGKLW